MDFKIMNKIQNTLLNFTISFYRNFSKYSFITLFILSSSVSVKALTLGVADFKVHDTGLNVDRVSQFFQMEIQKAKRAQVRDRRAIKNILKHLQRCQTGLVSCKGGISLKALDLIVFGEFHKDREGYMLSVRAVSERSWTVVYAGSFSGSNHEELLQDIAEELNDKIKVINARGGKIDSDGSKYKYRVAIYSIKNANEQAQNVRVTSKLNSILISAFSKKGKFQIIESSMIKDLKYQKVLAMSGLVQTNRKAFQARGLTHYLTGSLKVFDEVKVLSYQIINVKTGLPTVSDTIEWADEKELKVAMDEVAKQSEVQVFDINGKLVIQACDLDDVSILVEDKKKGSFANELGLCPLTIEDMPKGNYTLIFKHEDRDTLIKKIVIKPQETTRLKLVKMPPIDMSSYYKASGLESKKAYKRAVTMYRAFYKRYPRHRMATYALYREGFIVQIHLKQYQKGRRILESVIKRRPDAEIRTEAYYGIALGYRQVGKKEAGNKILKMLINEYPTSTAAEVAKACLDTGNCSL